MVFPWFSHGFYDQRRGLQGGSKVSRGGHGTTEVGAAKQQLEIPLDVVADIPTKVDSSVPWRFRMGSGVIS